MNPSHATASILEYLPESFENIELGAPIYEAEDLKQLLPNEVTLVTETFTNDSIFNALFEHEFSSSLKKLSFRSKH